MKATAKSLTWPWATATLIAASLLSFGMPAPGLAAPPNARPAAGASASARAEAPPTLGRLFYSPDRRQALDAQRATNRPAERKVESRQLSFDGMVRRSGGRQTVWVNGQAMTERDTGILSARPDPAQPGRARLSIPNERGHELAVGHAVNRETGEIRSPLGSGRLQVHPRP